MKTIEIIVDAKGENRVQTKGYSGAECRDASAFIEKALGDVGRETLTAEFYQQSETSAEQRTQHRPS